MGTRGKVKNDNNIDVALRCVAALLAGMLCLTPAAQAEDSVCAEVKLALNQELTLERQAFEAHIRINNGLTNITLEDVQVTVTFTDEDGESSPVTEGHAG